MSDAEMTHPKMADWVSQTQEMSDKYKLLYTGYDRHVQNVSTQGIADTYTCKADTYKSFEHRLMADTYKFL